VLFVFAKLDASVVGG